MPSPLANGIATMEGFFKPNTLAANNNNPGNLRYAGQAGAIGADSHGFAIFATVEDGWAALENQIGLDADRGDTLGQFMNKYAPSSDGNDTSQYVSFLTDQTGISADTALSDAGYSISGNPMTGSRPASGPSTSARSKTPSKAT